VNIWRRSFEVRPPALAEGDERNPAILEQYREVGRDNLPLSESLKDTIERVVPYYEKVIRSDMEQGKRVLITAHGNTIRALVKTFDNLSNEEIMEVNIPTGIPLVYIFNEQGQVVKKYYLGDENNIREKVGKVSDQGKVAV